ncbi:MAG: hypothetical protein HXX09_03915 [Bacteroidetes bacterium]|nr:hypothetical protein [Bacteroidota bacterium]
MKSASINELKKEIETLPPNGVIEVAIRLAKFKKDNKELLNYLLFESHDELSFINKIKLTIDELFEEINESNLYFVKKTLRKILRIVNKNIKYSGIKQTEAELLIYFCTKLKSSTIPYQKSPVLNNLYNNQIKKIQKTISLLHEDLQFDYSEEIKDLI